MNKCKVLRFDLRVQGLVFDLKVVIFDLSLVFEVEGTIWVLSLFSRDRQMFPPR